MQTQRGWRYALGFGALGLATQALARVGGGESYDSGGGRDGGGGDGGGDLGWLIYLVVRLTLQYPHVMFPLLAVAGIGWYLHQKKNGPTPRTQRAFQEREAQARTAVSSREVESWISALKVKDPGFELIPLLDKSKQLFLDLQSAWFRRDLTRVRPFLSDATYQRLNVQLRLLDAQQIRDAIAEVQVLDLQLVGLDQNPFYDTVHVRIRASMRDTDVPSTFSDDDAEAAARRSMVEAFTEVWSFVRKPGAVTKLGEDAYQGKCPNCGGPFNGGAANSCEFCGAVVNSGNYDWTLAEITQGVEFQRQPAQLPSLEEAQRTDPALNLNVLEDRASLIFWRWIDAQSRGDVSRLAKVAAPEASETLGAELRALQEAGRRKVFLECAVGGVNTKAFNVDPAGDDRAHVEFRWSSRMGVVSGASKPELPTLPQRWVFTLRRKHGAQTPADNGMATFRCPNCNAALSDSASAACEFCGTLLSDGQRDWVLESAAPFESWQTGNLQRASAQGLPPPPRDTVVDREERERLLYMMAALAAADGTVDEKERRLLKNCAERWSVPWNNVELALKAGPALFERLVPKGSPEAETFLQHIVDMALVDGKVDRKERQMLVAAALHLGMSERLKGMLRS